MTDAVNMTTCKTMQFQMKYMFTMKTGTTLKTGLSTTWKCYPDITYTNQLSYSIIITIFIVVPVLGYLQFQSISMQQINIITELNRLMQNENKLLSPHLLMSSVHRSSPHLLSAAHTLSVLRMVSFSVQQPFPNVFLDNLRFIVMQNPSDNYRCLF